MRPTRRHPPSRSRRYGRRAAAVGLHAIAVCVASWLTAASPLLAAAPSAWQSTPYRVRVVMIVSSHEEITPQVETQLRADLTTRIGTVLGAAWEATVTAAPAALSRAATSDLHGLTAEMIPASLVEGDKVMLLMLTPSGGGWRVAARDFDVYTHVLSPGVTRSVWHVGMLRDVALDALFSAFAPLARIDRVEKGQAVLRLKAAALAANDAALLETQKGDLFLPIMRSSDRDGKFRQALPSPWTFCTVASTARNEVRCQVISGLRSGLALRRRSRTEALALRIKPPRLPTTLVLQSRTTPSRPLAGYAVFDRLTDGTSTLVGRTDRQGRLVVPPGKTPVRVLMVKNGGELLARLPVVPGLEPQLVAEVANDDYRLEAEGFITGLQEELVDLVARRAVLVARIEAQIEAKKFDAADPLFDALRRLPTARSFLAELTDAQRKLASKDPVVQRKIDALLADTRKLIDKHLDQRSVDDIDRAFRAAKKAEPK
jgi:hypothetical protein